VPITNYLSIDVEDYFQVSAFEQVSPPASWDSRELRVEGNTDKVLALLDEASVKATFFVLGWVAERCPELVKRIAAAGHEVASHGYGHQRLTNQTRMEFREDVRRSKAILEELSGRAVFGYRAPSYSISRQTFWAFDELYAAGYRYDSSIFPIRHDFYGIPDWPRFAGYAVKTFNGDWQAAAEVGGMKFRSPLCSSPGRTCRSPVVVISGCFPMGLPAEVCNGLIIRINSLLSFICTPGNLIPTSRE